MTTTFSSQHLEDGQNTVRPAGGGRIQAEEAIRAAAAAPPEDIGQQEPSRSAIVDFYRNKSVLITGGSGFIGKVLIEKLLRTCPGIRRIFVLIRPKWNKKPHERLEELLGSPLFDGVRKSGTDVEQKVLLVEGDVTEAQLGLSDQNLLRIMNEVSVVYHSAATVKFDEPLKQSVAINIAGVKNMVEICRKIPQLAALVHVSTAYANCDKEEIDEHIYPVGQLDPEKLIEMANWLDQDTLQELKMKLLGARPNTYTYTKALAEWLLVKSARDLPVVICRPSIVVASHREPFSGWIDNINGPTGVILGVGKGLVRTMLAQREYVADLVPVDSVINLIITLGWFAHVYRNHKHPNELTESQTESLIGSDSASADAESLNGSDDVGTGGGTTNLAMSKHQLSHNNNSCANYANSKDAATDRATDECNGNNNNNNNSSPHFVHEHHHHHHLGVNHNSNNDSKSSCSEKTTSGHSESAHATKTNGDRQMLHLFGRQAGARPELAHLDDGYGTQSPDHRSPSTSSSSSCSLKHAKKSPETVGELNLASSELTTTTNTSSGGGTTNKQDEFDECDCNYNLESCNLIENENFQSFVAQRRLAEQKHAAFEYKLKQFRHNIQLKLAAKSLPEELADVPVFHCTSGAENHITWGQIRVLTFAGIALFPSLSIYRYPSANFTGSRPLDVFYHWTLHLIPAYIADFIMRLLGKKTTMVRIFRKFEQASLVLEAFTMKEWRFSPDNRLFIYNELLSDEDRRLFNLDVASIDWSEFFEQYVLGVRKFILKESDDTISQARVNMRYTYYRNSALQILLMAMLAYYFFA